MYIKESRRKLGKGRSGIVFLEKGTNDEDIAVKVFSGEKLAKLVNYIVTGAPNPYTWNEDAAWSILYTREILKELVPICTGSRLRVAEAKSISWNEEYKAYELHAEFDEGRQASLSHCFSKENEHEISDLVNNIMNPLQENLIEAGFDGLAWQAGKGNPVARNNFLYNEKTDTWAWIDLESGVPALTPLNPLKLPFYGGLWIKYGHPSFDDVDTDRLRSYVFKRQDELQERLGEERFIKLMQNINNLEAHHKDWKSMKRAHRSITYSLKKGKITEEMADYYYQHTARWYAREGIQRIGKLREKIVYEWPHHLQHTLPERMDEKILDTVKFALSTKYRKESVHNYCHSRISHWEDRRQLTKDEADYLRDQVKHEHTTKYLTDFMFHLYLKPLDVTLVPGVLGYLVMNPSIGMDPVLAGLVQVNAGAVMRTTYTLGRIATDLFKKETWQNLPGNIRESLKEAKNIKEKEGRLKSMRYIGKKVIGIPRLIALSTGMVHTWGNGAYLLQMLYSAPAETKELSEFLVYDLATHFGTKVPIFGGEDTGVEHFFNRLPNLVIRNRRSLEYRVTEKLPQQHS